MPSTEKELRESISSPQFLQMVNAFRFVIFSPTQFIHFLLFSFSFALQSRELGAVLTQSGFPDDVIQAANQGDIPSFAQALNNYYKTSAENNDHSMETDE